MGPRVGQRMGPQVSRAPRGPRPKDVVASSRSSSSGSGENASRCVAAALEARSKVSNCRQQESNRRCNGRSSGEAGALSSCSNEIIPCHSMQRLRRREGGQNCVREVREGGWASLQDPAARAGEWPRGRGRRRAAKGLRAVASCACSGVGSQRNAATAGSASSCTCARGEQRGCSWLAAAANPAG
eukprot:scaffold56325_cov53-Phaeocystis_antarctica.AAC.2